VRIVETRRERTHGARGIRPDVCERAGCRPSHFGRLIVQCSDQQIDRGRCGWTHSRETLGRHDSRGLVFRSKHGHEPGNRGARRRPDPSHRFGRRQRGNAIIAPHEWKQQTKRELGMVVNRAFQAIPPPHHSRIVESLQVSDELPEASLRFLGALGAARRLAARKWRS
jgi:hypothetical protein